MPLLAKPQALAPALRQRPALDKLCLCDNPFGDEGLATLLAPPPPAGTPPLPAGGLNKLELLDLSYTQITDAGCAALAAALDSGVLPALVTLEVDRTPASTAAPRRQTPCVRHWRSREPQRCLCPDSDLLLSCSCVVRMPCLSGSSPVGHLRVIYFIKVM